MSYIHNRMHKMKICRGYYELRFVRSSGSVSVALECLHIHKNLKQEDAFLSLQFNFALEYVIIMKSEINQEGLELTRRHQRLAKADGSSESSPRSSWENRKISHSSTCSRMRTYSIYISKWMAILIRVLWA
jgi:hypothetical protein